MTLTIIMWLQKVTERLSVSKRAVYKF